MDYDILIVGGGPAGLSAAINGRARGKTVLLLSSPREDSPLWKAERVENYLGLPGATGAELLTALTQNDLPMLQGLESRLTTLEQGVLADDTDKFIHKMSAIRRELNRENRFYAQLGDFAETMQEDAAELLGHRAQRRVGYFARRGGTLRSETQMLREYATQISGEYQAQVDILQNRVMKLLTIVTTIFLPLSLIVGCYLRWFLLS